MTDLRPPPPVPAGPLPPPPAAGPPAAPPALSRLWFVAGPLLTVLVAALIFVLAGPAPYVALAPGTARSVEPLITVSQKGDGPVPEAEQADDDLLFVTVSVKRPSGFEILYRLLDETNEVVPEDVIDGTQTAEETRDFNLQLMTDSKDKAITVALERAGYAVEVKANGAVVVNLDPTYPVASVVRPGDTIVGAAGGRIATSDDLVGAIASRQPGDRLELVVVGFGATEPRTVEAELAANPDTGKAQLGVSLEDRPEYVFPVDVDIDSGDVGGPSAGLAFTLAVLDQLTPGSLTGDRKVAVTGTISLDGSVGQVGGVVQKTEAAIGAGAEVFLVPPAEFDAATEAARGRLQVRQVRTLDDALEVLREFGGDPVPSVPADAGDAGSGG